MSMLPQPAQHSRSHAHIGDLWQQDHVGPKRCFGARNGSGYKGEDSPHFLFVGRHVWRQSPRRELIQLTAGLLRGSASLCSASPVPRGHTGAQHPTVSPRTPHQHCRVPGGPSRAEPGALRFNQSPKGQRSACTPLQQLGLLWAVCT